MQSESVEEISPLLFRARLACTACANWVALSGRLEDVEPMVRRRLWSNDARHELDRLPPFIAPLVQEEVERYAGQEQRNLITLTVFREARNRGKVSWSSSAEQRLLNVPAPIRAMAKVEIERMAIERGLSEVTEDLMNEAKAKFLGMRG
jgi:hypothetical protein